MDLAQSSWYSGWESSIRLDQVLFTMVDFVRCSMRFCELMFLLAWRVQWHLNEYIPDSLPCMLQCCC